MVYPLSVVKQTGLFQDVRPCGVPLGDNRVHEGHLTGGRAPFVMPAPPEQTRDPGNTSGGAEGTRTPDPLVANSGHGGVEHALDDGQYAQRRASCEEAARQLGLPSLREVAVGDLDVTLDRLSDDEIRARARHVVTEIERVRP